MQATTKLRTARINAIKNALYAQRTAAKQAKHQQVTAAHNAAAYMQAVQQLATQYGLPAPTLAKRAVRTTQLHAASTAQNPCKQVHAFADIHKTRAATLAACTAAGINPATASTQYAKWLKLNKATPAPEAQ